MGRDREVLAAVKQPGMDAFGRDEVFPPTKGDRWIGEAADGAVAGVQFVMRGCPNTRRKDSFPTGPSRLGEQGTWALWAHGVGSGTPIGTKLLRGMDAVAGLLETPAGIRFLVDPTANVLRVDRLPLQSDPLSGRDHRG